MPPKTTRPPERPLEKVHTSHPDPYILTSPHFTQDPVVREGRRGEGGGKSEVKAKPPPPAEGGKPAGQPRPRRPKVSVTGKG